MDKRIREEPAGDYGLPRTESMTLEAMTARLAARRAEIGPVDVPRNSGTRRTASKRALLAEIGKLGRE